MGPLARLLTPCRHLLVEKDSSRVPGVSFAARRPKSNRQIDFGGLYCHENCLPRTIENSL